LTTANSDLEKAYVLNGYFYSVFSSGSTNHLPPSDAPTALSKISITEEDVYNVLINLDTSKAMGPDGISPVVLSKCASVLCKPLHHLFCLTLKQDIFQGTGKFIRSFLYLNPVIPCKLDLPLYLVIHVST